MKTLLNNHFRPVTDGWGFIKAPYPDVADAVYAWLQRLRTYSIRLDFHSSLAEALANLEPLNDFPFLIGQTASDWTALFRGHHSSPSDELSYITQIQDWQGVAIACVEDDYDRRRQAGRPGSVQMTLFGGPDADEMNYSRIISATNQCSRWEFDNSGKVLPFEQPERYKARRIRDRFTPEMLEQYCQAMGICLFDETFYGPRFTIVRDDPKIWAGIEPETYERVQSRMREAENLGR